MKLHLIAVAKSSAYYRLWIPYYTWARKTKSHLTLDYLPSVTPVFEDALILHKPFQPYLEVFLESPRRVPIITDIDDLLWNPPPWSEAAIVFRSHPDWRKTMIRFLRESDAVTVSTEKLKEYVLAIAPRQRVFVLPNMLDLSTFTKQSEPFAQTGRITIGWYGSKSHVLGPDFHFLGGLLQQAVLDLPYVHLGIIGPDRLDQVPELTRGWPEDRMWVQPWVEPEDLPKHIARFTIGLAPLADGEFNACKSDLKPLEYAAAGVFPVFSDVETYRDVPVGRRCRRPVHWITTLRTLCLNLSVKTVDMSLLNKWTPTRSLLHQWAHTRSIEQYWWLWHMMLQEVVYECTTRTAAP